MPDIVKYLPGTLGATLRAGLPNPSGGGIVTSYFVDNTSGSTQATNFTTPITGLGFKQGEMDYPSFQVGGVTCPFSIGGISTWPDGSIKHCSVMLLVPSSIAGSGNVQIDVLDGGSAPTASTRALSDLTAADLKAEVTGVSGLSGTWTGSLNDAITANTDVVVWMDGDAGKVWRVGGDMKQSAAAHGQLYTWHYVAALSNPNGTFRGIRYLGRVAQPWGDVASPTVATRVVTATVKTGATTIRTLQGYNGSETLQANISMDQYTSFFTCGTAGQYDYVQGGGSVAADSTTRIRFTPNQITRTKLMPPYDNSLAASSNSSVDYNPFCKGHMLRYTPNTGERDDIGLFPSWIAKAVIKQAAVDERAVRVNALAAGGWRIVVRQQSTKNVIAGADIQASYTGMGTLRPSWRHWPAAYMTGLQNPGSWASLWAEEFCSHHRASAFYYAALITGEQQYFDMMAELATVTVLNMEPNAQTWSTTLPITNPVTGGYGERGTTINGTTYKAAGLIFRQDVYRIPAWGSRDVAHAAALLPDSGTAYSGVKAFCRDVLTSCYNATTAYNNAMSANWRDSGLWSLISRAANDQSYESPWALGYFVNSICHQSNITPETGVTTFRNHLAKFGQQITADGYDVACWAAYRMNQYLESQRVDDTSQLVFQIRDCTLTFNTSTDRCTTSGPNSGWSFTDGDILCFSSTMSSSKPFTAAVDNKRFYAVNSSGNNCQLAATPGGAAIDVTTASVLGDSQWMAMVKNFSPRWSFEGYTGADAYVANIYGAVRHLEACGESVNATRTRQDALLAASGTTLTGNPKNAFLPAYPS